MAEYKGITHTIVELLARNKIKAVPRNTDKKRTEIHSVARPDDDRKGEVPYRQQSIQKQRVDVSVDEQSPVGPIGKAPATETAEESPEAKQKRPKKLDFEDIGTEPPTKVEVNPETDNSPNLFNSTEIKGKLTEEPDPKSRKEAEHIAKLVGGMKSFGGFKVNGKLTQKDIDFGAQIRARMNALNKKEIHEASDRYNNVSIQYQTNSGVWITARKTSGDPSDIMIAMRTVQKAFSDRRVRAIGGRGEILDFWPIDPQNINIGEGKELREDRHFQQWIPPPIPARNPMKPIGGGIDFSGIAKNALRNLAPSVSVPNPGGGKFGPGFHGVGGADKPTAPAPGVGPNVPPPPQVPTRPSVSTQAPTGSGPGLPQRNPSVSTQAPVGPGPGIPQKKPSVSATAPQVPGMATKGLVPHAAQIDPEVLARRASIAAGESRGSGGYGAVGPTTKSGDNAYGKYQMMGKNIPGWSKAATGREYTPAEFKNDWNAQDKTFDKVFGGYSKQYGNAGASSMWFSGSPDAGNQSKHDVLGTTPKRYAGNYVGRMKLAGFGEDLGREYIAKAEADHLKAKDEDRSRNRKTDNEAREKVRRDKNVKKWKQNTDRWSKWKKEQAEKQVTKEETINELSKKTMAHYIPKAADSEASEFGKMKITRHDLPSFRKQTNKFINRKRGIQLASRKLTEGGATEDSSGIPSPVDVAKRTWDITKKPVGDTMKAYSASTAVALMPGNMMGATVRDKLSASTVTDWIKKNKKAGVAEGQVSPGVATIERVLGKILEARHHGMEAEDPKMNQSIQRVAAHTKYNAGAVHVYRHADGSKTRVDQELGTKLHHVIHSAPHRHRAGMIEKIHSSKEGLAHVLKHGSHLKEGKKVAVTKRSGEAKSLENPAFRKRVVPDKTNYTRKDKHKEKLHEILSYKNSNSLYARDYAATLERQQAALAQQQAQAQAQQQQQQPQQQPQEQPQEGQPPKKINKKKQENGDAVQG